MFMCRYAHSFIAQEQIYQFIPNLAYLYLETRKRTQDSQNCTESVLSSIPGEGTSCSSEIKHYTRTVPRPKLFTSERRLQKRKPQPQKAVLSSIPDRDLSCCSESKLDRKMVPKPKFFVLKRRLQN
jgi:hypothetical protein